MKNRIDVIDFDNERYFRLNDENRTYLLKELPASYILRPSTDPEAFFTIEMFRKKSICMRGHIYDSGYIRQPVYAWDYSEVGSISTGELHTFLFASYLQDGDQILIDTQKVNVSIARFIKNRMDAQHEMREIIATSTAKFIDRCKSQGIGLRMTISSPSPYPHEVKPNIWIIN